MNKTKSTEIKKKLDALRAKYIEASKQELEVGLKEFFDKYPDLQIISWPQYTPYFNDGDTCEFSSHAGYATINGRGDYEDEDDEAKYPELPEKVVEEIQDFLGQINEDVYESVYGDHVEVTITRKGTTIDYYDHD